MLCAAAAAGCIFMSGCGDAPQTMPQTGYDVMSVTTADREISATYPATIEGRQDIAIYPQVSGTISKVLITEGQKVRRGQTLFIIDQVPYKAALQMAEANVKAAEAGVATAQLLYDSRRALYDEQVISEYDLSTSYNQLLTAKAQLAQAEAQRVTAANNLSYTTVVSPADGVTGVLPYRQGALVSPQMPQPLTTVSDNSEVYVYFSIPENNLLDMTLAHGSIDKALEAMPDVRLRLSNGEEYASMGRIESISGVINRSTGSVSLRAVFPNQGSVLHSGASGNVIIATPHHDAIFIPQSATYEVQDKVFVYKVIDGIAKAARVEVRGTDDAREYLVESGLSVGDRIVAEGVGMLRDGTPITIKEQK